MREFIDYCFLENWKVMMLVLPLIVVFGKKFCKHAARLFKMPYLVILPLLLEMFILVNFAVIVLFDSIQQSTEIVVMQGIPQYLISFTIYFAYYQVFDKVASLDDEFKEVM